MQRRSPRVPGRVEHPEVGREVPVAPAQIEPFGTHPDSHRRGIGRALLYHGLGEMKRAGMHLARVCTDDDRLATAFYEGIGFRDVDRLRWWKQKHDE